MKCDLSQFNVKKLLLNHIIVSFNTKLIPLLNFSVFEFDMIILVSSANSIGLLVTANVPSSLILVTLMMKALFLRNVGSYKSHME
jgi:hypothetical protein